MVRCRLCTHCTSIPCQSLIWVGLYCSSVGIEYTEVEEMQKNLSEIGLGAFIMWMTSCGRRGPALSLANVCPPSHEECSHFSPLFHFNQEANIPTTPIYYLSSYSVWLCVLLACLRIGSGGWSTEGVTTVRVTQEGNNTVVQCNSTHLTSFAVLVNVAGAEVSACILTLLWIATIPS